MHLSIVAMALAGINNAQGALWLNKCKELHHQIADPHLKAVFTFLTCDGIYDSILVSTVGYFPFCVWSCALLLYP